MSLGDTKGRLRHQRIKFKAHRTRNNNPCDSCRSRKRCCERINEELCALCFKASKKCTFRFLKDKEFRYDRGEGAEPSQDARNGTVPGREEVVLQITDGDLPNMTVDNAPKSVPVEIVRQERVVSHDSEPVESERYQESRALSNSPSDLLFKQYAGQIDVLEKVFELH